MLGEWRCVRATAVHRAVTSRWPSRHVRTRTVGAHGLGHPPPPPCPSNAASPSPACSTSATSAATRRATGARSAGARCSAPTASTASRPPTSRCCGRTGCAPSSTCAWPTSSRSKGRFPVDTYPVTFHHLSVMDKTWDREAARSRGPAGRRLPPRPLHRDARRGRAALRRRAAPARRDRRPAGRVPLRRRQGPHRPAGDARARRGRRRPRRHRRGLRPDVGDDGRVPRRRRRGTRSSPPALAEHAR